jgi:signal transduction histidine kinase
MISILAFGMPALAHTLNSASLQPVVLTDGQGKYPLGLYLETLEDAGGKLTIDDVSSPAYEKQFLPSQAAVPNYGFSNSAYWVRIHLKNLTSKTDQWLLELGFANMHYADLYLPSQSNNSWIVSQTGTLRPFSTRDIPNHHIVFKIPLPVHEERTIFLRFQSGSSMTLPLTLWLPEAFFQSYANELLFLGLFYGALLIMLVYHVFVFYSLREASYFYYVCFLTSVILLFFTYDALAAQYLWPNRYLLNLYTLPVFTISTMASILMFVDTFLEIRTRQPGLHRLILFFMAGWGIALLLVPFVSYHRLATLLAPHAILSSIIAGAAGVISWQSGYQPARFFLFSWLGLLIGLILVFLVRVGLTSSTEINENLARLGSLWLTAFWSISLTDRIHLLKNETENTNRALQSSEHKLSQILEGLPLAVVMYGKDRKPSYGNKRTYDLLTNRDRNIRPDISAGRTLDKAIQYYSLKQEGTDRPYPVEKFPVHSALQGKPSYADDIEVDNGDRRIPLELWASPMMDEMGNVESAVVAFQDISLRKQEEAELTSYRNRLEALVQERTHELNKANEKLMLRLDWLYAVTQAQQSMTGLKSLAVGFQVLSDKILFLLNAELVFIHGWDNQGEQSNVLSHTSELHESYDINFVKAMLKEESPLRREIERGKIVAFTSNQADSITQLLGENFPKHEMSTLVFAPIQLRQSVIGVLGVTASASAQSLIREEYDLIERMALDLASLMQSATLVDQALVLATVEERNRLARELHDSVTQTLFTASVLAEAAPRILEKDAAIGRQNLTKLSRLIRGALAEMRSMLIELRTGDLRYQTLEQLLVTLAEGAQARAQAVIDVSLAEDLPELPEKVLVCFYRVAREALNNASVHSGAANIQVSLTLEAGVVRLLIQDDGGGFEAQLVPPGHLGLNIMGERAREIGATFTIQSAPGAGTTVSLAWPTQTGETTQNG